MRNNMKYATMLAIILSCLLFAISFASAEDYWGNLCLLHSRQEYTHIITSSGEASAPLAFDGSTQSNSKWYTDAAGAQYIQFTLRYSEIVTRWVVKHAGCGGLDPSMNARDFKLQYYNGTGFMDVDIVTGNTENVTDRIIAPVKSDTFRLVILTPNQVNTTVNNIFEFELYRYSNAALMRQPSYTYCAYSHPYHFSEVGNAFDGRLDTAWTANLYGTLCSPSIEVPAHSYEMSAITGWAIKHVGAFDPTQKKNNTRNFSVHFYDHLYNVLYSETITDNIDNITERTLPYPINADYILVVVDNPTQPDGDGIIRIQEIEIYTDTPHPTNLIIDNDSNRCRTGGDWKRVVSSPAQSSVYGKSYLETIGSDQHWVEFEANVPVAGIYNVYAKWTNYNQESIECELDYGVVSKKVFNTNTYPNYLNYGAYYIDRDKGRIRFNIPAGINVAIDAVRFEWVTDAMYGVPSADTYSGTNSYAYARDGYMYYQNGKYWMSGGTLPQRLYIEFTEPRFLMDAHFYMVPGYPVKDFKIYYQDPYTLSWIEVVNVTGNTSTSPWYYINAVTSKICFEGITGPDIEPNNVRIGEVEIDCHW